MAWILTAALKPVDWWSIIYLVGTLPLTFFGDGVIEGVILRVVLVPLILILRWAIVGVKKQDYCVTICMTSNAPTELPSVYTGDETSCLQSIDAPEHSKDKHRWIIYAPKILCFFLDWYAPLLWIYFYSEIGKLIKNIYGPPESTYYYDDWVIWWEETLFLEQPARDARYASMGTSLQSKRVFGEYLHFCYFSFYFIIVGVLLFIYVTRRRRCWDAAVSAVALVFYICFSLYLIWPVKGPYYAFEKPDPDEVGYVFSHIVRGLLNSESSQGTATPSSHCAIATACWTVAWIFVTKLAIVLFIVVPGLVFATVWCGFHYGVDALSGVILGIVVPILGVAMAWNWPYTHPCCEKDAYAPSRSLARSRST